MKLSKKGYDYALQAITTKYHGPTNIIGSKISAYYEGGKIILDWDHSLNPEENHRKAAFQLFEKLGWDKKSELVQGSLPKSSGYCFIMVPKTRKGEKI